MGMIERAPLSVQQLRANYRDAARRLGRFGNLQLIEPPKTSYAPAPLPKLTSYAPAPLPSPHPHWKFVLVHIDAPVSFKVLMRAVCEKNDVTQIDLVSSRRTQHVAHARQELMYWAKTRTGMSLPDIGRRLGDRDHTTVLHGVRVHGQRIADGRAWKGEPPWEKKESE